MRPNHFMNEKTKGNYCESPKPIPIKGNNKNYKNNSQLLNMEDTIAPRKLIKVLGLDNICSGKTNFLVI